MLLFLLPFLNNPEDLDPSCKMFWKEKLRLIISEIRYEWIPIEKGSANENGRIATPPPPPLLSGSHLYNTNKICLNYMP